MNRIHAVLLASLLVLVIGVPARSATDLESIQRLAAEGKGETALRDLDELIKVNPNDPQARFLRGLLLLRRGDTEAAREAFEEMTRLFPRIPESFNNLAAIYAEKGEYEKARQALLGAIANAPDSPTVRANLGDLYTKLAADAYREALKLDPADDDSRSKLRILEGMFASGG